MKNTVNTVKPVKPVKAAKPVKPVKPAKAANAGKPVKAAKPAKPAKPMPKGMRYFLNVMGASEGASRKTPLTPTTINTLVAAMLTNADDTATAQQSKGRVLQLAHDILDHGGIEAAKSLDAAVSTLRETSGGKSAPKRTQAAYKLGKRYAACSTILLAHGRTFADVGTSLTDKKVVTINLIESIAKNLADESAAYHSAALAWKNSKGDYSVFAQAAEKAEEAIREEHAEIYKSVVKIQAGELLAAKDAEIAALQAMLKKASAKPASDKPARKPSKPGTIAEQLNQLQG